MILKLLVIIGVVFTVYLMFFKKIYAAFINSFKGIYRALQEEFAFRIEFILSAFLIPASFFIGDMKI